MPRFGLLLLMSAVSWLACRPTSSPKVSVAAFAVADSILWCRTADSLLVLAKIDSLRADTLHRQALSLFATARHRAAWTDTWTERFRHYRKRENYAPLCVELEDAVQHIWWDEDQHAGRLYVMVGFCLRQMGRNYAASVYYEKARQLSMRFDGVTTRNPAGPIYKTLANIKTRLGENEEAEKLFLEALDLLRRDSLPANAVLNAFTAAEIYSDLGIARQNAGELARALAAYDKGLAELRRLRSLPANERARMENTIGMLLANKASALAEQNQLPLAAQTVQAALKVLQPDKHNYRFNALSIQASIYEKMRQDSLVLKVRQQALQLVDLPKSGIEAREVSKLLVAMGWAALNQNDYQNAALLAQQALQRLYPRLSSSNLADNPNPAVFDPDPENAVAEALDLKGEALWRQYVQHGDAKALALADSATLLAIEMMKNLRDVAVYESSKLLSSGQSRRLFGRIFRILYAYSQNQTKTSSAIERAFTCSEQSKAVLLRQKVSYDALLRNARVNDSIALRERDLREQRAFLKNALFRHSTQTGETDDSLCLELERQIFRIEQQQRQLRQAISEQYHLTLGQNEVPPVSLAEVQRRLLRPGEYWISYFTDADSQWVYLIAIGPTDALFTRRPYSERAITSFLELFNNAQVAENRSFDPVLWRNFIAQAHALYQILLAPVLDLHTPRYLTLSPDGALTLLPFDLLLAQPAPSDASVDYAALQYVGLRVPIRLSLSASLERFYAERPQQRPEHSYVGFAPAYTDGALSPVRGGRALIDSMARRLRGRAFCDQQATPAAFFQHAPRSAILHFYGHAEAFDSFPDYSWMAFSTLPLNSSSASPSASAEVMGHRPAFAQDQNFIFAHQIYHTWLECDVVLLSACRTGTGKVALGEGALSLARAFQAAGCPTTVMSLWEVRDDATAQLMQTLLEHLQKGLEKDEALLRAKKHYLQTAIDPFPYFWAGFVLNGSPQPVRLPTSPWQKNLALLGACLLAVAALLFWRFGLAKL